MKARTAHGASLPLLSALQSANGTPTWEALNNVSSTLLALELQEDIEVVVTLGELPFIDLNPLSELGSLVVQDLRQRTEFPTCPDNDCEYPPDSAICRWCNRSKR